MLGFEIEVPRDGLAGGRGDVIVAEETLGWVEEGVNLAVLYIAPLTPVNTGGTRGAIQTNVTGSEVSLTGRVFNPLPHAMVVEKGSKKRWWPPLEPLVRWARAKFGAADAVAIAARVRYAIRRRGLKGHHMFRDGWRKADPIVRASAEMTLQRIRDRLAGGA
jgi:hypothetical protein